MRTTIDRIDDRLSYLSFEQHQSTRRSTADLQRMSLHIQRRRNHRKETNEPKTNQTIFCGKVLMLTVTDKLMSFHHEFVRALPKDPRINYLVDMLDDIITEASGVKFHSCPFCRDMLFETTKTLFDGTMTASLVNHPIGYHVWVCNSIGNHGGQALAFHEGTKNCDLIAENGPYCNSKGFCLWQVHGPLGHPVRCKFGRIDDQSR